MFLLVQYPARVMLQPHSFFVALLVGRALHPPSASFSLDVEAGTAQGVSRLLLLRCF